MRTAAGASQAGFIASVLLALVIAGALWGPALRKVKAADCAGTRIAILDVMRTKGARAAAASARTFAARCPSASDGGLASVRLLTIAGDANAALAALPAKRTDEDELAVAKIDFSRRSFQEAEEGALAVAKLQTAEWPQAMCLAAAAALNEDRPDRAESHLTGVPSDCARILRAAALAQRGDTRAARQLLVARSSDESLEAARESALGVLDLQAGDMEAAAADALAASSAADSDRLAPRPWVWYLLPSPRGASETVLRIAGPFDDAGMFTKVLEGDCARVRGNFDLAMKRYEEAYARGGRTAIADLRGAEILRRQGRPQLARGRLARALDSDPGFAPALIALALIEESESPALAAVHAKAALLSEPDNRDALRIASKAR